MKTPRNGSEARENAGYQAAIGFGLTSGGGWREFSKPITDRGKPKLYRSGLFSTSSSNCSEQKVFHYFHRIGVVFHVGTSSTAFQQILGSVGVICSKP